MLASLSNNWCLFHWSWGTPTFAWHPLHSSSSQLYWYKLVNHFTKWDRDRLTELEPIFTIQVLILFPSKLNFISSSLSIFVDLQFELNIRPASNLVRLSTQSFRLTSVFHWSQKLRRKKSQKLDWTIIHHRDNNDGQNRA